MNSCYILLGTNLGDKSVNLYNARFHIEELLGMILECSSVYETAPWGRPEQDSFLNQVLKVRTDLDSKNILSNCLEIEKEMGRVRVEKWMERIIDIDILYHNHDIHNSSSLVVPHPEIQNRRFTLVPLVEISPDYIHPILKKTNKQLLDVCQDPLKVNLFTPKS